MNKLGGLLIFILGVGVGSGATYYLVRERFEAEQNERVEQIKAAYDAKYKVEKPEEKEEKSDSKMTLKQSMLANKKNITDYTNIIKSENYIEKQEEKEEMSIDGEIIIEPDNHDDIVGFGLDPFDVVFATIYADGYLVDSSDNIIDIEEQIGGRETLEHFGEGDDPELLHVRNNLYEIDYEIDRDERTYAEVSGKDPSELPVLDY